MLLHQYVWTAKTYMFIFLLQEKLSLCDVWVVVLKNLIPVPKTLSSMLASIWSTISSPSFWKAFSSSSWKFHLAFFFFLYWPFFLVLLPYNVANGTDGILYCRGPPMNVDKEQTAKIMYLNIFIPELPHCRYFAYGKNCKATCSSGPDIGICGLYECEEFYGKSNQGRYFFHQALDFVYASNMMLRKGSRERYEFSCSISTGERKTLCKA